MSIQSISNFYIPNVSFSIKITKSIMKDEMLELGDETIQTCESNLQIEHGITDFWTKNSSYKMLIESDGIAKMDSRELKIAINKNLQKLFGSEFNYDIKIC